MEQAKPAGMLRLSYLAFLGGCRRTRPAKHYRCQGKNIGHREPEPLSGYLNNRYTQCGYHMLMHKAEVMRRLNRLCLRGLRKCHAMETVI